MIYKINQKGLDKHKYAKNEVIKMFIFNPVVTLILLFLTYFSIGSKSMLFFYIIMILFCIYFFIFGLFVPFRFMVRYNKTISEIEIINSHFLIKTFKILWKKTEVTSFNIVNMNFKFSKFNWYGKKAKEGILIKEKNKEYYLVKDYFTDYEEIKKKIFM